MNKEFIAAIGSIALMFVGLAMGASVLVFIAGCATIAIGCYSAYHYKGQKNYWYPIGVIGAFMMFVASSAYPGGIICTLLMFVFLGSVLYFSWHADKKSPVIGSAAEALKGYCGNCGDVIYGTTFCPSCGTKIDATK